MRLTLISVTALLATTFTSSLSGAQIRRGLAVDSNAVIKVWNPSGSLRLVAWDRDSVHVEGTAPKWAAFYFGGTRESVKFGIEEDAPKGELPISALVVHVPRGSRVTARTVDATIDVDNVSGFYYTASGAVRALGTLRELQVESLRGTVDVDVRAPWVRIMGGEGDATVRGTIEDLAASTVAGRLTAQVSDAGRARLETMTGDLLARVALQPKGSMELDSHAGAVTLEVAQGARVDVDASTVAGEIRNQFDKRQPQRGKGGKGASFTFATDPNGARVVVRTYKGTIVIQRG
jgi:hypothetical protein